MTAKALDDAVLTAPGFEPVREEFGRLLAADETFAGQFCAYAGGRVVADLWGGEGVGPDDLQGVFSSTKGAAAVCVALLVQRGVLDLDAPVARYWPEFGQAGKEAVTVRLALSHQAGLVGVEPQLTLEESMRHETMAARLAAQVPHWHPGAAHGYHALTIGTIIDELTRRITGMPVARMFREEVAQPRGVDFHIATPDDLEPRVKRILPLRPTPEQQAEGQAGLPAPDSLFGLASRFVTALDCADIGFLPDGLLDELPLPAQSGTGTIAGVDLNKPRIRAALSAALALAPAPGGFTVAEHAARVRAIAGHDGYTTRQAAYDLRKLRGKHLISKPGRTRRYHVPPDGARTIAALLTLRDHVIAPILAGVRSPRMGRKPKIWTPVDRDYEILRIDMQTLFRHVGIETRPAAA